MTLLTRPSTDDIVEYLAPSLEQHKGCTIIDVHPGACLFSQKIHDFLKPKWHLLMEPEERYLDPYIKPLLDRPGSTYCHTYLAGAHPSMYWESYVKLHEDPTLLPPRPALPTGDPKLRQLDPSLLVIGNLERAYSARTRRIDLASLILHQMPYAALSNDLFQRSGLVRMLWWIPERTRRHVIPRNLMLQSSFSHGIQMGVQATEVAGVNSLQVAQDESAQRRKRAPLYDRIGIERVAQRMRNSGMSAPEGRKLLGVDYQDLVETPDSAHKSPFESLAKTPAEIRAKIKTARANLAKMGKNDGINKPLLKDVVYPQVVTMLDYSSGTTHLARPRVALLVDVSFQILHLEASYKELEDMGESKRTLDKLKAEILSLDDDMLAMADNYSDHEAPAILDVEEETLAWYTCPQHTAFDRRPYEPLKLSSNDFFPPNNNLSLLDLMPETRDLNVPDLADNKEATKICQEMLRHLFTARNRSIVDTLNAFAVNAGQDLVAMVPAMSDARRGGRLNPRRMRTRMLTTEMTEGLVKAFFEWPFRPQTWEVTSMGDSAATSDGGEEGGRVEGVVETVA